MIPTYVLDAFAVLALIQDEEGADEVESLLVGHNQSVQMSAINVGEVACIVARHQGEDSAARVEEALYSQPSLKVVPATRERIRSAARWQAKGGLSFDAFAAALAEELGATLVTGDPEILGLEGLPLRRVGLPPSAIRYTNLLVTTCFPQHLLRWIRQT